MYISRDFDKPIIPTNMNNNINPHLYNAYLHLKDTLNAKMVHRRKRKTANSIEIVFLCDAINTLSGHINTLKEAEACGFWIVCRRQTGKKHALYHGLPVFQLFLTPVHPKKALENKIQAAQQAEEITFQPISMHKHKHKSTLHPTPYTLHPKKNTHALAYVKKKL